MVGRIQTKTGIPDELSLSDDHKRFYFLNSTFENIEIADIAAGR